MHRAPENMTDILEAFIRYTPTHQIDSLLQALNSWASGPVEVEELVVKASQLGRVVSAGLQAAVTRLGSRGGSSTSSEAPDWMVGPPEPEPEPALIIPTLLDPQPRSPGLRRNLVCSARYTSNGSGSGSTSRYSILEQHPRDPDQATLCRARGFGCCIVTADPVNEILVIWLFILSLMP